MKHVNLFWAIVWGIMVVLSVVGIFWNPAHIFTALISAGFCGLFIYDYIKEKNV